MKKIYTSVALLLSFMHYSYAQVNLLTKDHTVLSNWEVKSGELNISNNIVSSEGNNDMTLAFINLDQAIKENDILKLSFKSNDVTNFATTGWAGISLYTGGSSGSEQVFIGSLGNTQNWGVDGGALSSKVVLSKQSEIVDVEFSYNYNSGAWTIDVDGETQQGTMTSQLAFNTIRIGADINNNADIAISNLSVSTTNVITETSDYNLQESVTLFPNPSTNFIQFSGLNETHSFSIFNSLGTKVNEGVISSNETISTTDLNNGLYFISFENGNTYTFIKE